MLYFLIYYGGLVGVAVMLGVAAEVAFRLDTKAYKKKLERKGDKNE